MKAYDDKHIKNVVLVGAAKSGKTTLAETMMFEAGIINRRGSVEEKNTVSDYHDIEHERGSSVYATCMHTEWRDYKINIIDTPGLDDFIGEVASSIRVCDTAIMTINAQHGIEVGAELIWDYIDTYQKPTIFAINHLDHEKADFAKSVEEMKAFFGHAVTLMQYPVESGTGFNSIIDLLKMVMYVFPKDGGKPEKKPIPDSEKERANQLHNELVEKAAENDEKLMELYFEKGELDEDQMRQGIKMGMMKHDLFPVFCISALRNMGSGRMMGFIDNVAPSAIEMHAEKTESGKEIKCDSGQPTTLFVFKTLVEPHVGKLSFFKVTSGTVETGSELYNYKTDTQEKIGNLFIMDGKNRNPINKLQAGDIGCTLKLKNTNTNHTLNGKGSEENILPIDFPPSRMRVAVKARNKADEEKINEVLHDLQTEDPTLVMEYSRETKETILYAQGELHLNVARWRIKHIYGIDVEFVAPRIAYRETIQKPALSNYRHKKQSGGAGQFGEVYMKIEPWFDGMPDKSEFTLRDKEEHELPWGGKLVFHNCITGGVIDSRFIPSILKGVMEKMNEGPLTGSFVRDIRVSVYDGKMHPVDSNDISFKIAGMMAFKDAFHNAQPQLLEPIHDVEVEMPESLMGDVMTEMQSHRSMIMGMDSRNGNQIIKARTPLSEVDKLSVRLRSITQGRARMRSNFAEYSPVPNELQKKLHDEYEKTQSEEHAH